MLTYNFQEVLAQAPVNDVVSWPPGMLLLASVLYSALGSTPQRLFEVEPVIGLFLFAGLPLVAIPTMCRVNWVAKACHFVAGIRTTYGSSNFWVRAGDISLDTRKEGLRKASSVIHPVTYEDRSATETPLDEKVWTRTSAGMIYPALWALPSPTTTQATPSPTSRHFLLWAATEYHVFHDWEVEIYSDGSLLYTTKAKPASTVVDVDTVESAIPVVAAQMIRRPHSQSKIRMLASKSSDNAPFVLDLAKVDLDCPACSIDFHSYAPESSKVSASLRELAESYFIVVQYIKKHYPTWSDSAKCSPGTINPPLARVHVGQSLWTAILGGGLFPKGRLTIQNLPGRWGCLDVSPDEMYITRLDAVLNLLQPYANTAAFGDLIFSNGLSRRTAIPFLIAGLVGQVLICYFICVATTAGVWTSVALANVLYAGRLADWHSIWYGKTSDSAEPGFKMYLPNSKDLMCIATLDRTTPRQGDLRPGFLLNLFGLIAAILGTIFSNQTRNALDFSPASPTLPWVIYTSIALCMGTSFLIALTILVQQLDEKTWFDRALIPTRWMVLSTVPTSLVVSGLAIYFQKTNQQYLWPILDALTWVSGVPLGMLENGRMIAGDDNILHLVLLNRWIMGAVASSVGSFNV